MTGKGIRGWIYCALMVSEMGDYHAEFHCKYIYGPSIIQTDISKAFGFVDFASTLLKKQVRIQPIVKIGKLLYFNSMDT